MNFRGRQHGFSLIELLISLVIFTVGLMSIAGLQMVAKKSNYESLQRTTASHIAYAMLEEMRTNGEGIETYLAAPDLGGGALAMRQHPTVAILRHRVPRGRKRHTTCGSGNRYSMEHRR